VTSKLTRTEDAAELRQRAEALARADAASPGVALSPEDMRRALHELRVHQIELEMQNEELRRTQVELDASRARYFDRYDLAPVGYFALGETGLILEANLAAARLLGVDRTSLTEQPLTRFILPADQGLYYLYRKLSPETGSQHPQELRMLKSDGTPFWAHLVAIAAQDAEGVPVAYVTMSDITVRKQAEERLVAITQAVESTSDAIGISDTTGHHFYQNRALSDLFGYATAEELQAAGGGPAVVRDPDVARAMFKSIMAGRPWTGELEMVTKSGRVFPAYERADAVKDSDGKVIGLIGIITDISERKLAEETLRKSEDRYRGLFESSADALFLIDCETGQIVDANSMATLLYGYERHELLARKNTDLSAEPEETSRRMQGARLAPGHAFNIPMRLHRKKDGTVFPVEIGARSLIRNGQSLLLVACRDISERKQAEAERARLEARLLQAQKLESVGRLAGGVAHEFNNKLMGIMNYVELCRDELPPEHLVRSYLDEIATEAQHSAHIAHQLLAFARKQHIAPKVLNLNGVLAGMLGLLRQLLGEDIDLDWTPDTALWPVKLDPAQIGQVLTNLCANARAATAGVGKVAIATANVTLDDAYCTEHAEAAPGEYIRLTVSDTGCGMDAQMVTNLFDPFFTTQELAKGAGLGLPTVYGIVKQNAGHIEVQSEVGKGTTFSIYLPRATREAGTGSVAGTPEGLPRGRETILLTEDERSVRLTSRLFLEALGYTVLAADTPEEALRLGGAHSGPIHLLITDVIMPGMNGPDLAGLLVAKHPKLTCLFMSGHTADVMEQRGALGADVPFLAKPFSRDDLARKVREVLEGGGNRTLQSSCHTRPMENPEAVAV
jgi:PAS domain S-box-containing protein